MNSCCLIGEKNIQNIMRERTASSTKILDLNNDCLYCIFMMLSIKDQLQLANTCERFRLIVRQMIWRTQFQKIRSFDSDTKQLNKQEYQQFFHHIVEYLEELIIPEGRYVLCEFNDSYRPKLTPSFYFSLHFPRLTHLECIHPHLNDSHMRMIVENCPQLQVLRVENDCITGAHIKDMFNLHELYLPNSSLSREHLIDILLHLIITHLDVSDCNIKLPIDELTWTDLRFLKVSENQIEADFVEKFSYLRALNCLTITSIKGMCFPYWTGLFEKFGSIITSMTLSRMNNHVMSAFLRSINHLTALETIFCRTNLVERDLSYFVWLPALRELHLYTCNVLKEDDIISFIAHTKHLEHLDLNCWGRMNDFDWLLDVIRILREQKERPRLCLNLNLVKMMNPTLCDEIKRLVMNAQNTTSQPLMEVTFNAPADYPCDSDFCIELRR